MSPKSTVQSENHYIKYQARQISYPKVIKRAYLLSCLFQECIKNKIEKIKFNNQNTSDVNIDWSIWKNAINEAVLDVIGKLRKVNIFKVFETRKLINI
jgi:hypothetical protein